MQTPTTRPNQITPLSLLKLEARLLAHIRHPADHRGNAALQPEDALWPAQNWIYQTQNPEV